MKKAPLQTDTVSQAKLSPYDIMMLKQVDSLGGFFNAHAHLDRADTLGDEHLTHINTTSLEASSLPLAAKQNLTGDLHRGLAYTEENLRQRMSQVIERLVSYGTTRLTSCIDVTSDIGEDGLLALRIACELRDSFADRIRIEIGPSPIFGFKEGSNRWEAFAQAAEKADFISGLPEKDDYTGLRDRDGKVGFREHLKRVISLGCMHKKEVHLHLDQANHPDEVGTETLIDGLRWIEQPEIPDHKGPVIWVVHMLSPSAYSERRFSKLIDGLLEHNIGVIVCPTAAISMRQLRPINAPMHNSIARVLELCKRKVPIRLGTDNICDVFVPQSDGDMLTEIKMAGHACRFAIPHVWAKLSSGVHLNEVDRSTIGRVLYQDARAFHEIDSKWRPAVD
jgi:cytosine/creatinine deaminase